MALSGTGAMSNCHAFAVRVWFCGAVTLIGPSFYYLGIGECIGWTP